MASGLHDARADMRMAFGEIADEREREVLRNALRRGDVQRVLERAGGLHLVLHAVEQANDHLRAAVERIPLRRGRNAEVVAGEQRRAQLALDLLDDLAAPLGA